MIRSMSVMSAKHPPDSKHAPNTQYWNRYWMLFTLPSQGMQVVKSREVLVVPNLGRPSPNYQVECPVPGNLPTWYLPRYVAEYVTE